MALRKQSGELPEGSVRLSESEAILFQWKNISSWESLSDVWPLKYGISIAAVSSSLSAWYINRCYRSMLKLGAHGRLVSYLPTVVIPAIATSIYHQEKVLSDVLIMKSECPVCIQIRSSAIQAIFGGLYPAVLAPVAGFMIATRHYTYDVPPITESPKETFKLWLKLTRRIQGFLLAAVCSQALLGAGLAFFQVKSIIKVNEKILSAEKSSLPPGHTYDDKL
ncbi:transmembrane protein 126A [Hetaerina americana]|uniref:transmembrane protein 126A n=1 Tax=Hetaerina americana TaxID=62018 RepID=UPI003A7F1C6A